MKFSTAAIVVCASLSAAFFCVAKAQDHFPSKPIRIIVPTGAGGPNDLVLRILSDKYSSQTGQAFVIENRTGGSGSLAAQEVARATPDGYVLLAGTPTTLSINPHTIRPARYDPENDFAPITQLVTTNFFFLARADLPAKNLDGLIALAKHNPGKTSFGSSGPGSITHLIMAMFGASASIDFLHVPYRSTTLAINDLIAGHIDTAVGPIDAVTEFVKAGKIKVLAVASAKRAATMPEVPTFGEEGHPDVVASLWMGLLAPAGTPQPIVRGLYSAMAQALQAQDVKEKLETSGQELIGSSPAQFAQFLRADRERWGVAVRASGIQSNN